MRKFVSYKSRVGNFPTFFINKRSPVVPIRRHIKRKNSDGKGFFDDSKETFLRLCENAVFGENIGFYMR